MYYHPKDLKTAKYSTVNQLCKILISFDMVN